jgi:uncharacterized protein (TIGR01777 family)
VLVSQSAIGFYGAHGSEPLDETAPAGQDFLARAVIAWEAEARAAEDLLRVVYTRTGVVLSAEGGALKKMLPIFRAGLGGPVGSGRQYMSWIHIADQAAALIHASRSEALRGPVNLTAPNPVTNREFSKALGRVLGRPAVLPAPAPALKLAFGEMSGIVLSGQKVVPRKLTESGYRFAYPQLEGSLTELLS